MLYKLALYKTVNNENELNKLTDLIKQVCTKYSIQYSIDMLDKLNIEYSIDIELSIASFDVEKHVKTLFEKLTETTFNEVCIDWDLMI